MRRAPGTVVLTAVFASAIPARAHHPNPLYFDMSTAMTLEGNGQRVEWIDPHVLLYLESRR